MQEKVDDNLTSGIIVDQWCVLAQVHQDAYCDPEVKQVTQVFDLDTYKILRSFLLDKVRSLRVQTLSYDQLNSLGITQ